MRWMMAAPFVTFVLLCCSVTIGACGSGDESTGRGSSAGEANYPECKAVNWRKATPQEVACPGVSSCLCGAPEVCCFTLRNSGGEHTVDSSTCTALADCGTLFLD